MRIFLAVARANSIAAAGTALGLDHATVSRRLAAFERAMGQGLVTRSRSGIRLTDEGSAVLALAERAEPPLLALSQRRASSSASAGTVRLATSGILGAWLLPAHVPDLQRADPLLRLEISVTRRLVDLSKREADIALRLRPPGSRVAEPSTLVRKLADVGFALYGTRDAVRARERRFIRYSGFEPASGQIEGAAASGTSSIVVDEIPTALMLARAGSGLAVLPCFMADREPSLERASRVLESHRLYVAVLSELRKTPRIDAVFRWLERIAAAERTPLAGA